MPLATADKPPPQKPKYPRVATTYPRVIQQPKDSEPKPVFLKCPVQQQDSTEDRPTTDLDIHFEQLKLDNLELKPDEARRSARPARKADSSQSLVQYCNFDEKKVVKVAPHIRRKDIICDTVDAWSRREARPPLERGAAVARYRPPLVFGGTFPIDAPLQRRSAGPKTFAIDAPTSF